MAETEKMMSDRGQPFQSLAGFLDQLRRRDYHIGIDQYIAVHRLLLHLYDQGQWPDDPKALAQWLAPWLAPIVCRSPEEQEDFYQAFSDWVETWQKPSPTPPPPLKPDNGSEQAARDVVRNRRALIAKVALGTGAALTLAAVLLLASRIIPSSSQAALTGSEATARIGDDHPRLEPIANNPGSSGQHGPEPAPLPLPVLFSPPDTGLVPITLTPEGLLALRQQSAPTDEQQGRLYRRIAATALPGLLIGGVLLWGTIRRLQLKRNYTKRTPPLERLRVKGLAERFFNRPALRAAAQQMRRHRLTSVRELAVEATIFETTRKAGWFTPIYTPRRALPEYLVLVDRFSQSDHQSLLDDELINQLSDFDVILSRYYFSGDPRICRKSPGAPALKLETLEALHPDHALLIFGDGAQLIHPLTGQVQPWLDLFAAWPERALFTPVPQDEWGYRERLLEEAGFAIVPATEEGLAAFVRLLQTGRAPRVKSDNSPWLYPDMLKADPERWVEDEKPEAQEVEILRTELQYYLGLETYYWLAACALYPRLQWGITLFLGHQITAPAGFNQRLMALARLPWFRHGTMPEWFRTSLVMSLPAEQEQKIRKALDQLLLSALENPEGFELEIASDLTEETAPPPRSWIGRLLSRVKDRIKAIKDQHARRAFLNAAPPDSRLRDYVFLSFLSGQKPDRLAVSFPKRLRRLLFPGGHAIRGVRPQVLLLMAALLSVVGWSAFRPAPPVSVPPSLAAQSPAGVRGQSVSIKVMNTNADSSCADYSLKNVILTAPNGSGISLTTSNADDCRMTASANIAGDAPTGTTTLTLKLGDTEISSFLFPVNDQPFPNLLYTPTQGTQGQPVTLTIFDKGIGCAGNSLKTATLSAPADSGITIRNLQKEDCKITASLNIAPNAPTNTVNLTLSRGGLTAQVPFIITRMPTVTLNSNPPGENQTDPNLYSTIPKVLQPGDQFDIFISVKDCTNRPSNPKYDLSQATLTVEPDHATRAIMDVAVDNPRTTPCRLAARVSVRRNLPPIGGVIFRLEAPNNGLSVEFKSTVVAAECPVVKVQCPTSVRPGSPVTLTATVTGAGGNSVVTGKYRWYVTLDAPPQRATGADQFTTSSTFSTVWINRETDGPSITEVYPPGQTLTNMTVKLDVEFNNSQCPLVTTQQSCQVQIAGQQQRGKLLVRFQNVGAAQGELQVDLRLDVILPGPQQSPPRLRTVNGVYIARQNEVMIDDLPYGDYRLIVTPRGGQPFLTVAKIDREQVTQNIDAAVLSPAAAAASGQTTAGDYPIRLQVTVGSRTASNTFLEERDTRSLMALSRPVAFRPDPLMRWKEASQAAPSTQQTNLYQVTVRAFDTKTGRELTGISIYYFRAVDQSSNAVKMSSLTPATASLPAGNYNFFAAENQPKGPGKQLSAVTNLRVGK
jgi:hypothetical protein